MKTLNNQSTTINIRLCETDAGGHVSNTSYFLYLEEARSDFFECIGFVGREKRKNIDFIVAATACNFIAQVFISQQLTITTIVEKIGSKSFTIRQEIKDAENNSLVAVGSSTIVCFDYHRQQTEKIPLLLREMLEKNYIPA